MRDFSGAWFIKIQAGDGRPRSVDMSKVSMKLFKMALCLSAACLLAPQAFASKPVAVTATFTVSCANCSTDISGDVDTWDGGYFSHPNGPYSMQNDTYGSYSNSSSLVSQVITHNAVYTLDTLGTMNTSLVRSVAMHFFSPVAGSITFPDNVLPACWQSDPDQDWPINLSVFSNTVDFTKMQVGSAYSGFARVQFNNNSGQCYDQINKFTFHWYAVCIVPTSNGWVVTSDACGLTAPYFQIQTNYGEGNLSGQGGKHGQTINYGDWRLPFQLTLTKQ
jgi:hypothetical protein